MLEALLRLRQAACHPGLIDKRILKQSSAKLDVLLENLEQVLAEGHKALVFRSSPACWRCCATSSRCAAGATNTSTAKPATGRRGSTRFQTDPDLRLFLVSLKAGGLGLNLTAASYVFLLDPWWNPAVEAQAIDRAHRIGQEQPVFAYRIIAADTVEQKILELQEENEPSPTPSSPKISEC